MASASLDSAPSLAASPAGPPATAPSPPSTIGGRIHKAVWGDAEWARNAHNAVWGRVGTGKHLIKDPSAPVDDTVNDVEGDSGDSIGVRFHRAVWGDSEWAKRVHNSFWGMLPGSKNVIKDGDGN